MPSDNKALTQSLAMKLGMGADASSDVADAAAEVSKAGAAMAQTGSSMKTTPQMATAAQIAPSAPVRKSFAAFNQGG
jgi:hypothetical protein